MSQLIALAGAKGAGKDTVFQFMNEWAAEQGVLAVRRGFADKLKHSLARMFIPDCSEEEAVVWMDTFKYNGYLSAQEEVLGEDGQTFQKLERGVTGRVALQRYGTESHRSVFGDDFWVDALLPLDREDDGGWVVNFMPPPPISYSVPHFAVITDCRFENEAKRVQILDGEVWEIVRGDGQPEIKHTPYDAEPHASEVGLPPELVDVQIDNSGNLDHLRRVVWDALDDLHAISTAAPYPEGHPGAAALEAEE